MKKFSSLLGITLLPLVLAGCLSGSSPKEIADYIKKLKSSAPGKVEQLPTLTLYTPHRYAAQDLRSPFESFLLAQANQVDPLVKRKKEYLEQFPLDALKFIGTVLIHEQYYALLADNQGFVHIVKKGQHIGQNYGLVDAISDHEIKLIELYPTADGQWDQRPTEIKISDGRP